MTIGRKQLSTVVATACLGVVVGWVFMPPVWKHRIRMLPALLELAYPKTHTFQVSGSVVDDDGNMVEHVLMTVSEHTPDATGKPPKEHTTSQRIDGSFAVTSQGFSVLTLEFDKQGYKPAKLDFTSGGSFSNCEVKLLKEGQ